MKEWLKNQVKLWQRESWLNRLSTGKGPIVSNLDLSKPRRVDGPFVISPWGYQPASGEKYLHCQPWGTLEVCQERWLIEAKHLAESFLNISSKEELTDIDSGRFVVTRQIYSRGFFDRNNVVSLAWGEPNTVRLQPLKGADRSAVGVPELGRLVDLEQKEDRVCLKISSAEFVTMIDELLHFSEVMTTHKRKKGLALLAEQGVKLRRIQSG